MLTYVIALLVALAILYFSYRALGGGHEPVPAGDYRALLGRLFTYTTERIAEVDGLLEQPRPVPVALPGASRVPGDPLVETGAEVRKKLAGYRQQLAQIEVDASGDELDLLSTARSLLSAAIEDESWACRLLEGGSYRENPGIQDAVAALRAHAERCMDAASAALANAPALPLG